MDPSQCGPTHLLIDTGNVINIKELKQKASQSPSEELVESIICTLQSCQGSSDLKNAESNGHLVLRNSATASPPITQEERKDLKLTVKIFVYTSDISKLSEAVREVMTQLSVAVLDSLIVAFPCPSASAKLSLEGILPLWRVLEELVTSDKAVTIGVSDLDTPLLKELYDAAQVKPSVNQVNLESCCVMPPDMTSFAKENDIQLLTHSDPKVLLSKSSLQECLAPLSSILDASAWVPDWVARYSVFVKCRGIIQNKGYLLTAHKEN